MGCGSSKLDAAISRNFDEIAVAVVAAGTGLVVEVMKAGAEIASEAVAVGKEIAGEAIADAKEVAVEVVADAKESMKEKLKEVKDELNEGGPKEEVLRAASDEMIGLQDALKNVVGAEDDVPVPVPAE
jgi:hypothetical protein